VGESRNQEVGIADRGERDEGDAIGKVIAYLVDDVQSKVGFADASRPSEGEQADL
jgi:hypothetical protein